MSAPRFTALRNEPELRLLGHRSLSNCTTAIADHVNELIPGKVPWGRRVILPGYSGELAHELGLLDTDLSFEEAQRRFHINERAERFADDPKFSVKIREVAE